MKAIGVNTFINKRFDTFAFDDAWKDSFGEPEKNFKMIVYGSSGNGKTEFSVKFAKYLATFGKVAYCSYEQGISKSLQDAIVRNNMEKVSGKVMFLSGGSLPDLIEYIRKSGSKLPIVILGYTPVSEAENLAEYDISQAVFSLEYAKELSEKCVEEDCICKMHIKVDSGMSRIGFMCQEFPRDEYSIEEICEACCLPNLEVEGLFTHFCVSDEDAEGREFTNKQYENFIHVRDSLKKRGVDISVVHCSNSGAIEDYPETCCDMVRAGIILYGLAPSSKLADRLDLVPAMTLKTVVAFVKEVQKGATISYGRTFTADRKMKIATVPIGYADGFIRQNAKDGYMTVNGKKAKIVGRICMDQTMLDVTDIEDVKTGDEVVVFGTGENGEPTADSLAENTGTINYETVCLVGKRVPRIYIKDGQIENVMYKL